MSTSPQSWCTKSERRQKWIDSDPGVPYSSGATDEGTSAPSQKGKSTLQLTDLSSSTKSIRNKQMLKDVQASTKLLYWFLTHSGLKPQKVMGRTKMKPSQAACCAAMHDTFPIKTCNNLKLTDFLNVCCLSLLLGVSAVFYHLCM